MPSTPAASSSDGRASADPPGVDHAALTTVDRDGFAVVPGLLDADRLEATRAALDRAQVASEAAGYPSRLDDLDPGGRNVRVYDLCAWDPLFIDLALDPEVLAHQQALLGDDVLLSNFTANTALPGSGSMNVHNDQSTVMPEPWLRRETMNAIWCLDDVDEENGATRYLPGSHRFTCFAEVPDDPRPDMVAFRAPAGAVIYMDGRLWHTSGANRSTDRPRALLFAFYAAAYLRPQTNWFQCLDADTQAGLSPPARRWFGLAGGNMAHGTYLATPGGHTGS